MEEAQSERSYSKNLMKLKHDWEKKMRRSSQIFCLTTDATEPNKKEIKTEYMNKLQKEINDWTDYMKTAERKDDYEKKIEIDEQILEIDQLRYCQSKVDVEKWLEESAAFRKQVIFYLHKNANLNELRRNYTDTIDSKLIERRILDLHISKFDIGSTEELENNH